MPHFIAGCLFSWNALSQVYNIAACGLVFRICDWFQSSIFLSIATVNKCIKVTPTRSKVVIRVKFFQTELMVEI